MSIGKIHHRESNKATLFCHLQNRTFSKSCRLIPLFSVSLVFISGQYSCQGEKQAPCSQVSSPLFTIFLLVQQLITPFFCLFDLFCVRSGGEQEGRKEGYLRAVSFLLLLGKTRNQIQAIYRAQQQAPSLSRPSCPPCCFFLHGHPQGFQNPKFLLVCPCLRTSLGQAIIPDLLSSILLSLLVLFMS